MKTIYKSLLSVTALILFSVGANAKHGGSHSFSLMYFSVHVQDDNSVYAEWETNPDVAYSAFVIQHSSDGYVFDTLNVFLTSSAEPAQTKYDFVHTSVTEGMNFYRVIMIDAAGNSYYSAIADVNVEKKEKSNSFEIVNAFPVPAANELTLSVNCAEKSLLRIVIMGQSGNTIEEQVYSGMKGINTIQLNLGRLESGNQYTVIVVDERGKKQFRRIIKR